MGMPFAKVVEALEISSGPSKEPFESFRMMIRATDEMSSRSGRRVDREVDDPKMVWRDLLAHEDAADFAPPGLS